MRIKNFNEFRKMRRTFYISESSKHSIDEYMGIHLCVNESDESSDNLFKKSKRYAKNILKAFRSEANQTSDMIGVFNRQLRTKLNLKNRKGNPSPEEIKEALKQLKDVPKLAPYAIILLTSPIPFSSTMYTALAFNLMKVSKGKINLLPDSFEGVFDSDSEEGDEE